MRQQLKEDLLALAFQLGAVKISVEQPFRWASGYLMPIYNNNRLLLAHDSARRLVCGLFVDVLEEKSCSVDVIAGVATAGIPHATLLADRLDLPLHYVRSSTKRHGTQSQIEGLAGNDYHGARVVLVEDVISTGGSALSAVEAVRQHGGQVVACLAIFSYKLSVSECSFSDAACPLWPLLDFPILLSFGSDRGMFDENEMAKLRRWYQDPFHWKPRE